MTFLPIVDRELRVAARRHATYWTRIVVAVVSILLGICIFFGNLDEPEKVIGPRIFTGLSIVGLCYCLMAGRRFTVECLTEEKSEGTLGLLFLTDLKGHDVVLGKLAATSLNGFFGLLALLPVLAVPILMGGISNAQFWRMALVLVTTFLFSLAIGIYSSARQPTLDRAAAANLLLLLVFAAGISLIPLSLMYFFSSANQVTTQDFEVFHYASPIFAFALSFDVAYVLRPSAFWSSVGVINILSLFFVYRAGRILPYSWQERAAVPKVKTSSEKKSPLAAPRAIKSGEAAKRAAYRKRLLDINAFYWLAARVRHKPTQVWAFLGFSLAWWFWGWFSAGDYWFDPLVKIISFLILNTCLKLWIAMEAGQQFARDKRSGAFELLLSTPLTVRDILRGQWLALRRQFFYPLIAVEAFELFYAWMSVPGTPAIVQRDVFLVVIVTLIMLAADVFTLMLVAMWQALRSRSPATAITMTYVRVLVIPWLSLIVVAGAVNLVAAIIMAEGPDWDFYLYCWLALGLVADAVFGFAAWRKLRTGFRQLAAARFYGLKAPS